MLQGISLNLKRAFFFGWAILLLSSAEFLNIPSISGHETFVSNLVITHTVPKLLTESRKKALLWDSKTGTQLHQLDLDDYVNDLAFAPDGKTILTGLSDNTVRMWDSNTGTQLLRLKHDNTDGSLNDVYAVAFSPDGKTVLTGSDDKTARLWDSKTGIELLRLKHDDSVYQVAFAPDGSKVLTVSGGYAVILWDSETGNEVWRLKHDKSGVKAIFSPDGLSFLTASSDNAAKLWDSKTGTELLRFQHEDIVNEAVFSPDGSSVLTASKDSTARLWDSKTGIELWRVKHLNVYGLAFAPDGSTVMTETGPIWHRDVVLWDSKTGRELWRFQHGNTIVRMAFTPDGHGIYTGSSNGVVRLWNTYTGELIWETPTPFWGDKTWTIRVFYIWLALVFMVFFLPCLNWFDRGKVWYLRKPNRYIQLYQIPGVEHWLPSEEKK